MLVRALLLSLLPLAVPVGWLLWVRSRALRAAERDRTAAWFAYVRAIQHVSLVLAPAWMLGVQLANVTGLARTTLALYGPAVVTFGVVVANGLPLLIAAITFVAITADLQRRIRDVEQSFQEDVVSTLWVFLAVFVLIAGMPTALVLYFMGAGVGAVLLVVASVVIAVKLVALRRRAARDELLTLTSGALHARVIGLASRAKVQVQSILILPKSRTRMANAFAMGGQRLAFTDYLLAQLDRREVDAIAAHELGHLRHKHPQKLTFGMVAVLVPAMSIGSQYLGAWGLAVASVVAALAFSALSRRFERQADAAAMELTGDPEAVISGLARLAQLNHLPLEWNKWDGSILTHPSTLARIRFVARRAGIDEARIRTLIESGLGERELYEIPSGVSAERVYSAGFRARHLAKMGWLLFAMQTATPALIFAAAHTFGSPIPRLVLDVIALGVTFAAVWVWFMNTGGGPYREVDVALRARFAKEGLALADLNARLVGFAPTTEPRFYDGTREWDAGYLIVEPDALVFIGEETRFRLPRAAVRGVHEITDRSHWRTMPWMAVTWSDAQGVDRTFMMRALVPTARRAIAATLGALNEVRAWHEGGALREAMQTACAEQLERMLLPLPPTSPVSSRAMHEIATPRSVVPTAICAALLAFGWSVLLGLGFGLSAAGGFDVFCVAMCSWALHVIPHWRIAARTRAAERARMATEASADKRAAA